MNEPLFACLLLNFSVIFLFSVTGCCLPNYAQCSQNSIRFFLYVYYDRYVPMLLIYFAIL